MQCTICTGTVHTLAEWGWACMWFVVDPRLPTPVYQQVVDGVKTAVAKGVLASGDKLPSVRELATLMTLNHNTVAKAYQQLERERVIEVVQGRGTYIAPPGRVPDRQQRIQDMMSMMQQIFVAAHYLQLSADDLGTLFQEARDEWERGRNQP